jgi:hypothetical protein
MKDFRNDIEKSIDEVLEKYAITEPILQSILNGELSLLKAKYGIDLDLNTEQWCFRSAKTVDVISYQDYYDQCLYFPTKSIENILSEMMADVSNALNNSYFYQNDCQSYSKYLGAPLFKYKRGNSPLIIDQLNLNSLDLCIEVYCRDWVGYQRDHIENIHLSIPFKELFSKIKMLERINDELEPVLESRNHLMDIINMRISIPVMTLDISNVKRNSFDQFNKDHGDLYLKRYASYKRDKEVLTTRKTLSFQGMVIKNPKVIQTVRFIYLLKISNWYSEKSKTFITALIANTHPEIIMMSGEEVTAIKWILDYLGTYEVILRERELYHETMKKTMVWKSGELEDRNKFINHFWTPGYFTKELGTSLLSHVFDQ